MPSLCHRLEYQRHLWSLLLPPLDNRSRHDRRLGDDEFRGYCLMELERPDENEENGFDLEQGEAEAATRGENALTFVIQG